MCNRFLRTQGVHSVEQSLEWGYAFDVHCNAFVPILLILYVVQFFFMPILISNSVLSRILGNTMYFAALVHYAYITFLGYNGTFHYLIEPLFTFHLLTMILSCYLSYCSNAIPA